MKFKLPAAMLGLIALVLLMFAARGSVVDPVTSNLGDLTKLALGKLAHVQITGEFQNAYLVPATGESETINLRGEGPILIPTSDIDSYTVQLEGPAELAVVFVTSYDGEHHWLSFDKYNHGGIERAGNTAITIYRQD